MKKITDGILGICSLVAIILVVSIIGYHLGLLNKVAKKASNNEQIIGTFTYYRLSDQLAIEVSNKASDNDISGGIFKYSDNIIPLRWTCGKYTKNGWYEGKNLFSTHKLNNTFYYITVSKDSADSNYINLDTNTAQDKLTVDQMEALGLYYRPEYKLKRSDLEGTYPHMDFNNETCLIMYSALGFVGVVAGIVAVVGVVVKKRH